MKTWNNFFKASRLGSFRVLMALMVLMNLVAAPLQSPVLAAGTNCVTTNTGTYTITPCITAPLDGATISGAVTVLADNGSPTGANPGVAKYIFYLTPSNQTQAYLLTDYAIPYSFTLPSNKFVDGTYLLEVVALMKNGDTSNPSSITITLNNGVTTLPTPNNTFAPTTGTTPPAGQPFTLVAAGDGADGATNSGNVTNLIHSWDPNLFLYLGDVYEKGTATEFYNWYGPSSAFYGRFKAITDPIIGNHEYEQGVAPGYHDYWDLGNNAPTYYSYDAAGWHFIALNSNCGLLHICAPGQAEYQWLLNDLNTHNNVCTIAYFHHPVLNVGYEGYTTTMNDMWALMAQHGVDIVLTGHDHDYQRWTPLDANLNPSPTGMTEFVAGGGGHGIQTFKVTDSRMLIGYDTSPYTFGALRLQLNQDGAGFQYINYQGIVLDSGAIPCNGAPTDVTAPSTPANLTATIHSATQVDLNWTHSTDNVGIAGYDIYRDGNLVTSVGYVTSYSDTNLTMGATYNYQVKARDAAGNTSAFSSPAPVTMPSVLFSDGFESGDLLAWSNTNLVVQQQEVYAGVYAARETKTSGVTTQTFATKSISPASDLYYSLRFKIISKGSNSAYLQRFRTSSNGAILGVFVSNTGRLMYRNDTTSSNSATGPTVSNGVWHQVQTHVHIDPNTSANGQLEVWLDGALVGALSTSVSLGTLPIGIVQLGDNSGTSTATYDIALDEVAVNTSFIDTTDSQSPSTPNGLMATASAPNVVNLTWNAATDNISVTGYDLYRNGAPLTTLGVVTSYTDTPVSPAFTYQYQVLARDAAGNTSALSAVSPAATVTTPADTTGPSITLTAPADGISVSANVILSADAMDDVGVEDVDFLVNGTVVGTVGEGGPYIITWDSTTVADGPVTITARAVDTSLNETTSSSRTITVNNAGGDTTPPTVPANFAATAVDSSHVNLSWNASNDNVAVTGYDIYRDGALLTGVGAVTSYTDTNVVIGATYQYQVLARDAAGNVSALTSAVSVTVPDVLFKDGFESGDLAQWTNNGLNIQQQSVLEGIYAAHGASNGSAATYAYKQLSTTHNDLYYSTWFKIASQGATSAYVQRFRTSTNGAILGVFVSSTGKLMYRNDVTSSNSPTGPALNSGVWNQIQAHVHVNGTSSQVEVWLNGIKVSALSNTLDLGTAPIGRVQLGDSTAADIYDAVFDEVAVDTSFIQASTAPHTLIDSGPLGTVPTTDASFSFSATAAGATFQCSLDGTVLGACTSPQAFAGLADGAHTFAVQATDASANVDPTPASRTWTVDTTAPTVTNTAPADAATDVAIATNVDATFSEAMNPASLTTSNFTLIPQGDTVPIAAMVSYDSLTNKATLHPTAALAYSATYVATVKGGAGGATDLAGNPLAVDTVWLFTTFAPDLTAPSVTFNGLADGATVSGSVTLSVDATDNVAVDHVDFLVNGTVVGTASSVPYSINWNTIPLANGTAAITAHAVDTSANSADTTINVTIDNDVTPPSAPTNLTAHAVSSGQVDLGWTAATDNVGVTGYDIYRDGAQLTTVGTVTSYSDTTTDPATTYSYQVLARDAAGHPSNFSMAATATTPAALFSDSFETGDLSQWSVVNGLVVQQQDVHSGIYGARATTSGPAANANKLFSSARYELYYSTWFKILSPDPNNSVYLQRFIKADTFSVLGVFVSKTGKLGYRNDISALSNTSTINVSSGVWHQVKTYVQIDAAGGPGHVDVWFDGVLVAQLSQAESLGNAPIARIQLGDNSTTPRIYDVAFDDVTVTVPADLALPSVTLTAPVDGALLHGNVSLTATASDNVAVDHVDFLVNGNVVSTDTSSPYGFDWNSALVLDGPATITATAVDTSSNSTSSSVTVTLDNTPPDTAITSKPLAITNSTTANFSFTKNDLTATLSCSLDGAAFTACSSPTSYTALTNGQHTFQVSATDPAGNVDPTPAGFTWTVDIVTPTVSSTVPTTNATNVPPITTVVANFSEAINPATITTSTFTVKKKQGGSPVSATVTYDPTTNKATLQPTSNLAAQTAYTATITGGASGVKDLAGNSLVANFSWNFTTSILDTTPPTVTLTAPTNGAKVKGSVTLSATATDNVVVASVSFLVNGAVVGTDTTSPYSFVWNSGSLADGTVNIQARAVDPSNNAATTTNISVTVDNTPPDTTITSGPTGTVASTTASFSFTATETATFACTLDGGAFSNCISPVSYTGLAGGAHTFQVRATDTAGNVDATPASQSWTVVVPPDTTITQGPSGTVTSTSASFSFTSTIGGSTFTCSLDGSAPSACTSPKSYTNLANGSHTFQVTATAQGMTDPTPASRTWTINLAPDTTITVGPTGTVSSTSASFSFTATVGGSTFTCSLDGAAFSACTSPKTYSGLANGSHTFQVAATNQGATDPTPASRTWTVDAIAPTNVIITAPSNGASVTGQVTISATANDNIGVVSISFYADGQLLGTDSSSPFSTNWNTNKVTKTTHTLYVIAMDAAGNTTQSATITVTVR
jgi:Big-like domain-containing protein/calcineurin-like phosphoesterase family protein/fibronectin type III domain protein